MPTAPRIAVGDRSADARTGAGGGTELARGYQLKISFGTIIAQRDVSALESWVQEAHSSGLTPFVAFANGLRTDWAAVTAALTLPWSTGPAEGHVHRLKLIKRQGYGRAKLDLLRRRVLAGPTYRPTTPKNSAG
ncbi:MAG: transposase [Chloroflexota bacterium]